MKQARKSYPPVRHLFILDRFQTPHIASGEVELNPIGNFIRSVLIIVFMIASIALLCIILPASDLSGMRYYVAAAVGSGTMAVILTVSLLNQRHGGGSP
jgi:hypothetical protein